MVVKNIIGLVSVITVATLWLYFLYMLSGPDEKLSFPTNLEEIRELAKLLQEYSTNSLFYTLVFFSSAYIYKQTFAIPGSVFLNLLSGALFGVWRGFILCSCLSACGASLCFLLSKYVTSGLLRTFFPEKLSKFSKLVEKNTDKLFYFLLSVRVFPMTPNWLVNMASPHVNIPLRPFFLSVLVGLMPYNFLTVQAGSMLSKVESMDQVISLQTGLGLAVLAIAVMGPALLKKKK
jgi:uncharacterized membrane protein YdjX (TVP38/TMEM64 family)